MSIIRHGNKMQLECDSCNETQHKDYHRDDFDVMISDAKQAGWRVYKEDDGTWSHICDDCR